MKQYAYGILFCIVIAIVSYLIKTQVPLGAPLIALLLGALLNPLFERKRTALQKGVGFSKRKILSFAIVLLGFSINARSFFQYWEQVLLIIPSMVVVMFFTYHLGSFLKLRKSEVLLIGIGNCICGSAAIAATSGIVNGNDTDIGRSLATINLWGIVLLFFFPVFLNVPPFDGLLSSYIIGGTLQSVGHVGAVGANFGEVVGGEAMAFKMCRVALLYPLCLVLGYWLKPSKTGGKVSTPWYVTFFGVAVLLASVFPPLSTSPLPIAGKYLLTIAMAGIGLQINLLATFRGSPKPLLLGGASCLLLMSINIAITFFI